MRRDLVSLIEEDLISKNLIGRGLKIWDLLNQFNTGLDKILYDKKTSYCITPI